MLYFSTDATILRMSNKVRLDVPTLRERFTTNGKFDRDKARDLLNERGLTLLQIAGAITRLAIAGYIDLDGITAEGIAKLDSMDVERQAEITRLGLSDFFSGVPGATFDQQLMDELNAKDY